MTATTTAPTAAAPTTGGKVDAVCAEAVSLAAQAARDSADSPDEVGEHLGVEAAGERTAVHRFATTHPGYHGWTWAVAVSRVARARTATVDEVWLQPGEAALLAPAWTPWQDRVRPGDLGPGDVHPTTVDDPRLAPGWSGADDPEGDAAPGPLRPPGWEPGVGRIRVLSAFGRDDAALRWADGETGPDSAMAKAAPAACSSCGWLLTIGGPLGQGFGICANAMSPADGRAVTFDHGCGAHSEVDVEPAKVVVVDTVVDEWGYDPLALDPVAAQAVAEDVEVEVLVPVEDVEVLVTAEDDPQPAAEPSDALPAEDDDADGAADPR